MKQKNTLPKISKKQYEVLDSLKDRQWVYISKFSKEERTAIFEMENYGFIQVRGRDKYDFELSGQIRRTMKGKEYLSQVDLCDLLEEERKKEECQSKRRKKVPRNPKKKPSEDYELTLDEINRIKDPEIRRKLLLRWARKTLTDERRPKSKKRAKVKKDEFDEQDAYDVYVLDEYD
ncbi:MAG: hypothetical protein ACFFC7_26495 [Candidatus Hermodarchaeota archaeon]